MLSSTIRSFSPSLQRRRRPVSTTSRRFKTLSVWLSILTVLNDLHHPAQGGLLRTRTVDLIITDICVMSCDKENGGGLTLVEIAPGVTLDEIKAKTQAAFAVAPSLAKAA